MTRLFSLTLLLVLCQGVALADGPQAEKSEFRAYDMTRLSWLPPSLQEKGYTAIPVFMMCHLWNGDYGKIRTNCNGYDFSVVNYDVVRQRAEESLGEPVVVMNIELTNNASSDVWHMTGKDYQATVAAVAIWQELIATYREVNPDTRIMLFKPIPRIVRQLQQVRDEKFLRRGQRSIDARSETANLIAPLFADKSLLAWPSAYLKFDDPELMREDRRWQIRICKEVYKTECVFAIRPHYTKLETPDGNKVPISAEMFYQVLKELEEDGADGFGVWLPRTYNNERYLARVKAWEDNGGRAAAEQDPEMAWLSAIDRFLSED